MNKKIVKYVPIVFVAILLLATTAFAQGDFGNDLPAGREAREELLKSPQGKVLDQVLVEVQNRYTKNLESLITRLERTATIISESKGLTEEQKIAAQAEVDALTQEGTDLISTLSTLETRNEFKELSEKARMLWKKSVDVHKKYVGIKIVGLFDDFLVRLESVSQKVNERIDLLAQQGVDTTTLQQHVDAYQVAIELAQDDVDQARAGLESIVIGTDNVNDVFAQNLKLLHASKKELHGAVSELRSAIADLQEEVGSE